MQLAIMTMNNLIPSFAFRTQIADLIFKQPFSSWPGFVPAIHVFVLECSQDVDAWHRAGHDEPKVPITYDSAFPRRDASASAARTYPPLRSLAGRREPTSGSQ